MRYSISGIRDLSLIDVVGYPCSIIFLPYCNFNCFWCHNKDIAKGKIVKVIRRSEMKELIERLSLLSDFIQISGGEPTLHNFLPDLFELIKKIGLRTSLCTNGSNFSTIFKLVKSDLLDHISIDIKASLECRRYCEIAGINNCELVRSVKNTVDFLASSDIQVEFRTTVIEDFHSPKEIVGIYSKLSERIIYPNNKFFVLQQYIPPNGNTRYKATSVNFLYELGKIIKKRSRVKVYIRCLEHTGYLTVS